MINPVGIFSQQLILWPINFLIIAAPKNTTKEHFYLQMEEERRISINHILRTLSKRSKRIKLNWTLFPWILWKLMILKQMKSMLKFSLIQFNNKTVSYLWSLDNYVHKISKFSQQVWQLNFIRSSERGIRTQLLFIRVIWKLLPI